MAPRVSISQAHLTWARTVCGESRGESARGQLAVAFVPYNRAQISGRTVAEECRRKWQFSCWNIGDPNRALIEAMDAAALAPFLVHVLAVLGGVADPSHGATFYHTTALALPAWAVGQVPCVTIGHHVFYKNIAPYRISG